MVLEISKDRKRINLYIKSEPVAPVSHDISPTGMLKFKTRIKTFACEISRKNI